MYRDALDLLTPARFDIPAKLIYARHWHRGVNASWARALYDEHIRVWNGHFEAEPRKRGSDRFVASFHALLGSIRGRGFDPSLGPVPVGETASPINGGHRIAACILYGQRVVCQQHPERLPSHNYDSYFFRERCRHGSLSESMLDAIAAEYCRLKANTYVAVVFPSAVGNHRLVRDVLSRHGDLVYEKSLRLAGHGPTNLVRLLYSGEPWLGSNEDAFAGARAKARACFASSHPTRIFVLEAPDRRAMARAKKAIRELFRVGNHSIHITDAHAETVRIAETLFNANGVRLLERRRVSSLPRLERLLDELSAWFRRHGLDPEDFCIGGSGTLAAYGLRDCRDLDLLHKTATEGIRPPTGIGSHHAYLKYYPLAKDEIIYDPGNHFRYRGVKFAALEVVSEMKKRRGEDKDIRDLEPIDSVRPVGSTGGRGRLGCLHDARRAPQLVPVDA
jgi:hypothetical protein